MGQIDRVVKATRRLERLLRQHFHAEGRGLHELITSCDDRLPEAAARKLRFIATVRNRLMHEDGYRLEDERDFFRACRECEQLLTPRAPRLMWLWAAILVLGVTLLFLLLGWFWPV